LATFAVGLLPSYAVAGVAAPILLVLLRFVQGIAVGGEWGGAVLMAVEHAPADKETFYGSFAQLGNSAGALLATGFFAILSTLPEGALAAWAWRLPFLASAVLIAVGLLIRLKVEESPVFTELSQHGETDAKLPVVAAVRGNWRTVLLGIGILPVAIGGYYLTTTFVTAYATRPDIVMSETTILNALWFAAVVELVATLGISWLGDKVGRVRVVVWGFVAVAQFTVLESGSTVAVFAVFGLMRLAMSMTYGPIAAVLAQMFRPQARYTSISLTYQVAGAIFGGLSPLVATLLLKWTGSVASTVGMLVLMAVCGVVCIRKAPQYVEDETALAEPTGVARSIVPA
jgi:MFS family permease